MLLHTSALVIAASVVGMQAPSGRPPIGSLDRYEPRVYDVYMEVNVHGYLSPQKMMAPGRPFRANLNLADARIIMPVITRGTFNTVDHDSIHAGLWLDDGVEDTTIQERAQLDGDQPFNSYRAVLPVDQVRGDRLRWRVGYQIQVWSSRINDAMAAEVDWPTEWPEEVRDGLRPQRFIESSDPIFTETVQEVSEGNLRQVPPYYAAKDLVRFVLQNVQVEEGGEFRGHLNVLTGMNINGAKSAATTGRATPHDLVCACVAMLRAANIPARPVVGMQRRQGPRVVHEFVSWAEFFLPGAGWVPFDPMAMRGKGLHRHVSEPWPEFGTLSDLNTRIPLAYGFTPPGTSDPAEYPAIWGWEPKVRDGAPPVPETRMEIRLSMASRGKGSPDPK